MAILGDLPCERGSCDRIYFRFAHPRGAEVVDHAFRSAPVEYCKILRPYPRLFPPNVRLGKAYLIDIT